MNLEIVNVGSASVPGWMVLLAVGALLMYVFGLWSVVWKWGKAAWKTKTGREAAGGFVDTIDDLLAAATKASLETGTGGDKQVIVISAP